MDLRSRSRSKTPYSTNSYFENDIEKIGNHVDQRTVTRTTRSTTTKILSGGNKITNIDQNHSVITDVPKQSNKMKNSRSERNLRSSRYKTSDYSSEDGETEISTAHTVDQNVQNQLIEEARKRRSPSNSSSASHISALDVYRAAGEYWNKYPKTDWTYSRHSKDRVEIAPGVIAMPNMSRRSIHSNDSNSDYLSDKQTNTSFSQDEIDEASTMYSRKYYTDSYNRKVNPRTLFFNNNNDNYHATTSRSSSIKQKNIFYRFLSVFTSIFLTFFKWISTVTYALYNGHNAVYVWFGKKIHKFVSKIMLLDTWLLQATTTKKKVSSLLALCLIPLLLIGGWWLLSGLGYTIYNGFTNLTSPVREVAETRRTLTITENFDIKDRVERDTNSFENQYPHHDNTNLEKIVTIKEKILVEPPSASEIASELTEQQLQHISNLLKEKLSFENNQRDDVIIEKIIQSATIQNIINNYNNLNHKEEIKTPGTHYDNELFEKQQKIIEELRSEISKMKSEFFSFEETRNEKMSLLLSQLKAESVQNNANLLHQLKRCCRHSFIQMENYVSRILGKLLGAPHPLTNEKEITNWLHSMFVAKQELESKLANLTQNLKSHYDPLIENNGHIIMNDVVTKISKELHVRIDKLENNQQQKDFKGELTVDSLTDEYVKNIVKDVLAIYDADKTGLVDYAMEPSGGQVLSTRCSESYHAGTAVVSVLGIPLWYPTNTPRTVITPGVNPGECWAFQNFPGFLVVKLAGPVKLEAFSYEHISRKLMPNRKIDSAPKDFSVYGLRNETDTEPILIGSYRYDQDGAPLQYFAAANHGLVFDIIELRVFSNHGNPNYTCLYRFRVHGTLSENST